MAHGLRAQIKKPPPPGGGGGTPHTNTTQDASKVPRSWLAAGRIEAQSSRCFCV